MATKKEKMEALVVKIHESVEDNTSNEQYVAKVEEMKKEGLLVYHVIDSNYVLGQDRVRMISYCFISDDDIPSSYFEKEFKNGYCYANVVNPTWDIEEMGSIGFRLEGKKMVRTA